MTDQTLNWVMLILAILAALGNIIAYLFARIELHAQRKETRELTALTHDLQRQLYRLNVGLDQDIQRLYRARDAVIGLQKSAAIVKATALIQNSVHEQAFIGAYADTYANSSELLGIARSIDNMELNELVVKIVSSVDATKLLGDSEQLDNIVYQAAQIHSKLSELIAEATKEKK